MLTALQILWARAFIWFGAIGTAGAAPPLPLVMPASNSRPGNPLGKERESQPEWSRAGADKGSAGPKRAVTPAFVLALFLVSAVPSSSYADAFNDGAATLYYQLRQEAVRQGRLVTSGAEYDRVQAITKKLTSIAPEMRPDAADWSWDVSYVQSSQENAMCLPGGKIFVMSGLVDRLSLSDDELAAVLGHEIAHALLEHGREKYEQRRAANVVVGILGIIAAIAGAKHHQDPNVAFGATTTLGSIGAELLAIRPYSRERELAADKFGAELAARAGFNPHAAISLQAKLSTAGTVEFLSTHPLSETRQSELAQVVPSMAQSFASRRNPGDAVLVASTSKPGASAPVQVFADTPVVVQAAVSSSQAVASALVARGTAATAPKAPEDPDAVTGNAAAHMPSKFMINAERYAKSNGCALPIATMVVRAPTYEAFSVKCSSGSTFALRCESGNCYRAE